MKHISEDPDAKSRGDHWWSVKKIAANRCCCGALRFLRGVTCQAKTFPVCNGDAKLSTSKQADRKFTTGKPFQIYLLRTKRRRSKRSDTCEGKNICVLESVLSNIGINGNSLHCNRSMAEIRIPRPPKAPCWHDVMCSNTSTSRKEAVSSSKYCNVNGNRTGTISEVGANDNDGNCRISNGSVSDIDVSKRLSKTKSLSSSTAKPSKRQIRARIHRTRSKHLAGVKEVPEEELTRHLANTRACDLNIGVIPSAEQDVFLCATENNRRCEKWLASVVAAEPLEDVCYTSSKGKLSKDLTIEPPVDSFSCLNLTDNWSGSDSEHLRAPFNTSASSLESDNLRHNAAALHNH